MSSFFRPFPLAGLDLLPLAAKIAILGEQGLEGPAVLRDASEGVQEEEMMGRVQERLMGVLAVDVDEKLADLFQKGEGDGAPVQVGPVPPGAGEDALEDERVARLKDTVKTRGDLSHNRLWRLENSFDGRLVGPGPDPVTHGPLAEEKGERVDEDRLPPPPSPRDGRETPGKTLLEGVDQRELSDVKFAEHAHLAGRQPRERSRGAVTHRLAQTAHRKQAGPGGWTAPRARRGVRRGACRSWT